MNPYGSCQGGAGPVPAEPGDRPSYWPTILVSFIFGLFGLIPAVRHSRMAERRGYKSSNYWVAFGISFGMAVTLAVVLPIVLVVARPASAGHANRYPGSTPTSAAVGSSPRGNGNPPSPSNYTHADLVAAAERVLQLVTEYPALKVPTSVLASLAQNPTPQNPAFNEACKILGPNCVPDLVALKNISPSDLQFLQTWGPIVVKAAQDGQLPGT